MGSYNFTMLCPDDGTTLLTIANADAQAWKDDAAGGGHTAECPVCGCEYTTEDDGVPVGSGGGVQAKDTARPKITSLGGTTSGGLIGGTVVRVNGHAFDHSDPTVKFDGVAGTGVSVLNDGALDVTTPSGAVKMDLADGPYAQLNHGSVTGGPYQVGETITGGTSGETAVVKEVGSGYLLIAAQSGTFTASETLTGGTSGATASYTDIDGLPFQVSETVTGATSAATATVKNLYPLKADTVVGTFTADEEITGSTSSARAKLTGTPLDGNVDVALENSYGQRVADYALAGAFEYTV